MSFALAELRRLVSDQAGQIGIVIALDSSQVRVATQRGAVVATASGSIAVGERVVVRGGVAVAIPVSAQRFPV